MLGACSVGSLGESSRNFECIFSLYMGLDRACYSVTEIMKVSLGWVW